MGVGGSGFATVVSQLFSAICCYIYIKKKIPILHIKKPLVENVTSGQKFRLFCN